jgi:hypothetical protein
VSWICVHVRGFLDAVFVLLLRDALYNIASTVTCQERLIRHKHLDIIYHNSEDTEVKKNGMLTFFKNNCIPLSERLILGHGRNLPLASFCCVEVLAEIIFGGVSLLNSIDVQDNHGTKCKILCKLKNRSAVIVPAAQRAYPESTEDLTSFSQLIDDLRDFHSSIQTFFYIPVRIRSSWCSTRTSVPVIETGEIA